MRTEQEIREKLAAMERDLAGWAEPDGHLCPTEPDPEEREGVRVRLQTGIEMARWTLGEEPWR